MLTTKGEDYKIEIQNVDVSPSMLKTMIKHIISTWQAKNKPEYMLFKTLKTLKHKSTEIKIIRTK